MNNKQIILTTAVVTASSIIGLNQIFNDDIEIANMETSFPTKMMICEDDLHLEINELSPFNIDESTLDGLTMEAIDKDLPSFNNNSNNIADNYVMKDQASLSLDSLKKKNDLAEAFIKDKVNIPTLEELNELSYIYAIPENLLYSLMLKESEGNVNALSHKKARGLFQFLPSTAKQFGLIINDSVDERTDIWKSADASARYLAWIFSYFHPDVDRSNLDNYKFVLAGYNAGISNVKKGSNLSIPNFKETINYVDIILGHAKGDLYLVKRGDKLSKIAQLNEITRVDLRKMNKGITQERLIAGKYLLINKSSFDKHHVVNKGDSLYAIARTYSVSIDELMTINNLTGNLIGIGQKIRIPF